MMNKFEGYFVAAWCLFMPLMSLLVIPDAQGTIIPYLLAFASVGLVLLKFANGEFPEQVACYVKTLLQISMVWLVLLAGSQLGDLMNPNLNLNLKEIALISDDNDLLFRTSLFTQSLYFTACIFITLYFRYFFRPEWVRFIFWGAWFFALYGLYDWLFFFIFHTSGDFIANRTFANGDHPGSWSQTLDFGGLTILRLKSFLGEPSYVSAVVIPYLFLALEFEKKKLMAALLLTAILSTSTTVYLGLTISVIIYILRHRENSLRAIFVFVVLAAALALMCFIYPDIFNSLFRDKLSGETVSGKLRMGSLAGSFALFSEFSPINWLFGIGFGYTYSALIWALTGNVGLLGDAVVLFAFLKPIIFLRRDPLSEGLRMCLISILVAIGLTLAEGFIPTTWMFLGLAFWQLDRQRQAAFLIHSRVTNQRIQPPNANDLPQPSEVAREGP